MTIARNDDILALEKRECQQSCKVSAKMSISERKKRILAAVVDEYIRTAEPVGSKHLAENAGLGCSSATIRNELAELVALGYLEQPHTSAGRVPTPMGYRMYVNELMQKQKYSLEETEEINRRLNAKLQELDDTISSISRLASQITDYPALAEAFVSGENRLLNQPEFRDPDKAHKLMSYLSGGGYILPSAEAEPMGEDSEIRVLIGPENIAEELKDSSVVIASYDAGDNTRGLIGIVGPTRMDYSAVAAKLKFLAAGLSKRLGSGEAPPEGMHNKLILKNSEDKD